MTRPRWSAAASAFLLGMAVVVAGNVAAGLLLYGGPGFLPSLSVVLATLLLALASGLLAGSPGRGREAIDRMRRRWLFALLAFTCAAGFSAGWESFRGFGASGLTQGLGLAFLAALPLHAAGRVFGALARAPADGSRITVGAAALGGAAVGALALGFVLFPTLSPTAMVLLALVGVSGGALVHGWALDELVWVEELDAWDGPEGRTEVERWTRGSPRFVYVAVRENGRLRALWDERKEAVLPEERAAEAAATAWGPPPGRILALGIGAAVSGGRLAARFPDARLHVVDPDPERVKRVLDHLRDGHAGEAESSPLQPALLLYGDAGPVAPEPADWLVLDTLSVVPAPPGFRFPPGAPERLRALLRPDGVLLALPLQEGRGDEGLLDRLHQVEPIFPNAALYLGPREGREALDLPPGGGFPRRPLPPGARAAFLVAGAGGRLAAEWPEAVGGFLRVLGGKSPGAPDGED